MDVHIEARGLVKYFSDKCSLNELHFQVSQGEIFGFIGPHGSGKSTLIKLLSGTMAPSSGELFIMGFDIKTHNKKIKTSVGYVPQDVVLEEDLSLYDNFKLVAKYQRLKLKEREQKISSLIRQMDLEDKEHEFIAHLNDYQKKKAQIGLALLHNPKLLLLDEPSFQLVPKEKLDFWNLIQKIHQKNITIVLVTKDFKEAEVLCDRIHIIDAGKTLVEGIPEDLLMNEIGQEVVEFFAPKDELDYLLKKLQSQYKYAVSERRVRLFINRGQDSRTVINMLSSEEVFIRKASLDDVFLKKAGYEFNSFKGNI